MKKMLGVSLSASIEAKPALSREAIENALQHAIGGRIADRKLNEHIGAPFFFDRAASNQPLVRGLRWLKPVFPGDTLSVRMTVLQARPMASRPTVGLVQSAWEVLNQHGDAVLAMEGWGMFRRRPAGTDPTA